MLIDGPWNLPYNTQYWYFNLIKFLHFDLIFWLYHVELNVGFKCRLSFQISLLGPEIFKIKRC